MSADNCWEYWDCPDHKKEKCSAYKTNSGKECFYLSEKFRPQDDKDFQECSKCPWYKEIRDRSGK
jgi:hypothetical protein